MNNDIKAMAVYRVILNCASDGKDLPDNETICGLAGLTNKNDVSIYLNQLIKKKKITRHSKGRRQYVVILATGESVSRVVYNGYSGPAMTSYNGPDCEGIEQAKTLLRSRYSPVYRADVTGGNKTRWVVGNQKVSKTELLAMAAVIQQERAA